MKHVPRCFYFVCLLFAQVFYHFMLNFKNVRQFKRHQIAKISDRLLKETLCSSTLNDVFLKIYPYETTLKFPGLEIGPDLTFMKSKKNICKAENVKMLPQNAIHPFTSTVKISS